MQKVIHDSDGDYVIFTNYLPDEATIEWTNFETNIGSALITASTCVDVNGEDHYIMCFRGDQLEIRDRITGNIVHHQDSDISPFDIKRNSAGELLFFVGDAANETMNVYKLSEEIYVSADNTQITQIHSTQLQHFLFRLKMKVE